MRTTTATTRRSYGFGSSYDECLGWIREKQDAISTVRYGRNRANIEQAMEQQEALATEITDFRAELDKTVGRLYDEQKKAALHEAYDNLQDVSKKKISCLQTMRDIVSLEENCGNISHDMDVTSVNLVKPQERADSDLAKVAGTQLVGFISRAAQDCVFGVEDNWKWIVKLVACVDLHLKNGAAYHEFFHEIDESAPWMMHDLQKIRQEFEDSPVTGGAAMTPKIMQRLQEVAVQLKQWESKCDKMWEKATRVVPVQLRTDGVTEPTAARAVCDYSTEEVSIREGEDILLLDNSDSNRWKIRNGRGDEGYVPALTVLIPGPYKEAIDAAIKMRLMLLAEWTNIIKMMGKNLICHMLTVFNPNYKQEECLVSPRFCDTPCSQIDTMRAMKKMDKQDMLRVLDFIEDNMQKHWQDYEGFTNLQERLLSLRLVLEEVGEQQVKDEKLYKTLVSQILELEGLVTKYQDVWKNWEMYKTALEASQNPELMLVVDKWQQLQFVPRDYFTRFWKNELPLDTMERSMMTLRAVTLESAQMENFHDEEPEETETVESGFDESRILETQVQTERDVTRARVHKVDLTDALGRPDSAETTTTDSGWEDTHVVERRVMVEQAPAASRVRRGRVEIQEALGTPPEELAVSGDQGFHENRVVETRYQTEIERPTAVNTSRARTTRVDLQQALGPSNTVTLQSAPVHSLTNEVLTHADPVHTITDNVHTITLQTAPTPASTQHLNEHYTTTTEINTRAAAPPPVHSITNDVHTITVEIAPHDSFGSSGAGESSAGQGLHSVHMMRPVSGGSSSSDDWRSDEGFEETKTKVTRRLFTAETIQENGALREGHEMFEEGMAEEGVFETNAKVDVMQAAHTRTSSADLSYATETRTAKTEQVNSAEMEERKTFIIRSVVDPQDESSISLQQAIMEGVIQPDGGVYYSAASGLAIPIPEAMTQGLIKVEYTRVRRSPEKRSSIGIITVKTIREPIRPYVVQGVKDTTKDEMLNKYEATRRGILDENRGVYLNKATGGRLLVSDAIDQGLISVEYVGEAPPPEVVSKTYAVRAVVDTRWKKTITFSEAVRRSIIDKETGAFKDTLTGDTMYVGDAIMRGFLKARKIDNAATLDIDPKNQMLVDKTEQIRKKVLQPLSVISAFKRAAAVRKNSE